MGREQRGEWNQGRKETRPYTRQSIGSARSLESQSGGLEGPSEIQSGSCGVVGNSEGPAKMPECLVKEGTKNRRDVENDSLTDVIQYTFIYQMPYV